MKISRKQLIAGLSGLLLIQIILIAFFYFFSFQNIKLRQIDKQLISGLKKGSIASFEIKDYMDSFSLVKKDSVWFVKIGENFIPANQTKVNNYITDVESLNQGVVVYNGLDQSSDNHFGFDEKNRQELIVTNNKNKQYSLTIGNTGSKRGTSYIRNGSEKKIREVKSSLATETSNEPINWAKRNIFVNILDTDVKTCEINSTTAWFSGNYNILAKEKADSEETGSKDSFELETPLSKILEDYALQNVVKNLLNIQISEYKLNGSVSGRTKVASIKITLKNGKTSTLDFYNADTNDVGNFIIDSDFDDYLYLIHEDDLKKIIKTNEELMKKE